MSVSPMAPLRTIKMRGDFTRTSEDRESFLSGLVPSGTLLHQAMPGAMFSDRSD